MEMYSEYKNDQHRQQAEEILLVFGRFTVQFERVCEAMRNAIMFLLRSHGLQNSGMEQVIIGDTGSAQLQTLLGALCNYMSSWDDADRLAIKKMLKNVKEITEKRNVVVHSAWSFGNSESESELLAVAIRQRTKQNEGAVPEVWGVSASYLETQINLMKESQVLLQRLHYCINQKEFKVSSELSKLI
jgi:hypothetical protein